MNKPYIEVVPLRTGEVDSGALWRALAQEPVVRDHEWHTLVVLAVTFTIALPLFLWLFGYFHPVWAAEFTLRPGESATIMPGHSEVVFGPRATCTVEVACPTIGDLVTYEVDGISVPEIPLFVDDGVSGLTIMPVARLGRFAVPADVDGHTPTATSNPIHFDGYFLSESTPHVPPQTLKLATGFGVFVVGLAQPHDVMLPTLKSLTGPVGAIAPGLAGGWLCYSAHGAGPQPRGHTITDQFGTNTDTVWAVNRVCRPATVNGVPPVGSGYLVCWGVLDPEPGRIHPPPVWVNDGLVNEQIDPKHRSDVCLTATVTP